MMNKSKAKVSSLINNQQAGGATIHLKRCVWNLHLGLRHRIFNLKIGLIIHKIAKIKVGDQ